LPADHQAIDAETIRRHQLEVMAARLTHHLLRPYPMPVDAAALAIDGNADPQRFRPHLALLAKSIAGVLLEDLHLAQSDFVDTPVEGAPAKLIILLRPVGEVVGVFVGIPCLPSAPPWCIL